MNKKTVLWISLFGTIIAFGLSSSYFYDFCFRQGRCWHLWNTTELVGAYFILFPLILFFSLITYFLREEVFRAWLRFAYVWMPLSLVVIYLSAGWTGGGFGIPNVLDQETVAIIFSGLFVIISLLLVIWKHFTFRRSSQV